MHEPLISVYIPTRNRVDSLLIALRSVLKQTIDSFEVIVVDDNSVDETEQVVRDLSASDSRVVYLRNTTNRGACFSRNRAIMLSRGYFVTGLDDDDEFLPTHLEFLFNFWKARKSENDLFSGLVFSSQYERIAGEQIEITRYSKVESSMLFEANHIGNQIFAPREQFLAGGLFDERMPAWQDLEFFYRLTNLYGPAECSNVPTYIFDRTPRPDRISSLAKDKIKLACRLMFNKHGNGNRRTLQTLLINQVYSPYYGIVPSFSDVVEFISLGIWLRGYRRLFKKIIS